MTNTSRTSNHHDPFWQGDREPQDGQVVRRVALVGSKIQEYHLILAGLEDLPQPQSKPCRLLPLQITQEYALLQWVAKILGTPTHRPQPLGIGNIPRHQESTATHRIRYGT